jgi:nucleoside-diphosphate-sugar epimerase
VKDSQADNHKARQLLGYEPSVSFDEGLRRTVAWHTTAARTRS